MVAILHTGTKPAWLEDDARVRVGALIGVASAAGWRSPISGGLNAAFLPVDHWAAPVIRAGLTPWSPALQGNGPPKDYAGGKVMLRDGSVEDDWVDDWEWAPMDPDGDIIGYEATPAQPTKPAQDEEQLDLGRFHTMRNALARAGMTNGAVYMQELIEEIERLRLADLLEKSQAVARYAEAYRDALRKLAALCASIDRARALVPDDDEGLAAEIFAKHLNAAQAEALAQIRNGGGG